MIDVSTQTSSGSESVERRLSSTVPPPPSDWHATQRRHRVRHSAGPGHPYCRCTFLLSYLAAVLHPDDFHQLLHPTAAQLPSPRPPPPRTTAELAASACPAMCSTRQSEYTVPRYVVQLRKAVLWTPSMTALMLGMDFATLQIICGQPAATAGQLRVAEETEQHRAIKAERVNTAALDPEDGTKPTSEAREKGVGKGRAEAGVGSGLTPPPSGAVRLLILRLLRVLSHLGVDLRHHLVRPRQPRPAPLRSSAMPLAPPSPSPFLVLLRCHISRAPRLQLAPPLRSCSSSSV